MKLTAILLLGLALCASAANLRVSNHEDPAKNPCAHLCSDPSSDECGKCHTLVKKEDSPTIGACHLVCVGCTRANQNKEGCEKCVDCHHRQDEGQDVEHDGTAGGVTGTFAAGNTFIERDQDNAGSLKPGRRAARRAKRQATRQRRGARRAARRAKRQADRNTAGGASGTSAPGPMAVCADKCGPTCKSEADKNKPECKECAKCHQDHDDGQGRQEEGDSGPAQSF